MYIAVLCVSTLYIRHSVGVWSYLHLNLAALQLQALRNVEHNIH